MYSKQIQDINTITWHNLHFILEHYTTEVLSAIEKIIQDGESGIEAESKLLDTKSEVIATVKTLKAMHTVIKHHRAITNLTTGGKDANHQIHS
ncbi:MAG: hypothetical protein U9R26_01050 [Campylobacterota bacterium]|nr:hypothetical protein [Campylobacterota bacterium]